MYTQDQTIKKMSLIFIMMKESTMKQCMSCKWSIFTIKSDSITILIISHHILSFCLVGTLWQTDYDPLLITVITEWILDVTSISFLHTNKTLCLLCVICYSIGIELLSLAHFELHVPWTISKFAKAAFISPLW